MTVRDWLPIVGALLIPIVVAAGTWWITWQQGEIADQRAQQAQEIETQRAEAERDLAEQRAQDEALQAYLDQMSGLLLESHLRTLDKDSEVRTLARARTITVLGRLDPSRKKAVIQFLGEAGLIQGGDERAPIIPLSGADLSDADLSDADLSGADLSGADLSGADLSGAHHHGYADDILSNTLRRLAETEHEVDLSGTPRGADLSGANLTLADLRGANLSDADLSGTDLSVADLRGADLSGADLSDADLSGAGLRGVDTLSNADLSDADLRGLSKVNEEREQVDTEEPRQPIRGIVTITSEIVTNAELEAQTQTRFLQGTTMPNGQKYEDWLASRGSSEDGETNLHSW